MRAARTIRGSRYAAKVEEQERAPHTADPRPGDRFPLRLAAHALQAHALPYVALGLIMAVKAIAEDDEGVQHLIIGLNRENIE